MRALRVRLSRHVAAAVTAVALACFAAGGAEAMTRSTRPHAHPVTQAQEPGPSHTRAHDKKSAASGKKHAPSNRTAAKASRHQPAAERAQAHGKGRHREPAPEPADDPVPMKRASRRSSARRLLRETASSAAPAHHSHAPSATHAAAMETASAEQKPITSDEFVRAAMGTAPASADKLATGVSHPDEMDDQAPVTPVPVIRKPQPPVAHVAAADVPPPPAASRVDGFGAEGAVPNSNHRTLARTMAAHRNDPLLTAKAPVLSGEEQNEITEEAIKPVVVPAVYTRGGRVLMPAPLKGSHDVLVHQNLMADHDGLERIQDDAQLDGLLDSHQLARLPESGSLHVNPDLPENRRYARPWTVRFAADTARAYAARFGVPLQVNSAVRTVTYQLRLMRVNGNAAAVDGDTASPHLTGQAIDIGKRGMSAAQLAWMRAYLLPLMQAGKIDVEEEFQQACFHVSVYRSYLPAKRKMQVAQVTRREAGEAQVEDPQ